MVAYNSMVHRLPSYPLSPEAYNKDHFTIKHIARVNGCKPQMIDSIIKKKKTEHEH